jgi:hypothetical protein
MIFGLFSVCKTCESAETHVFTRRLHRENAPVIADWNDSEVTVRSKTLVVSCLAVAALAFAAPSYADHGKSSSKNGPPTTSVSGNATVSVQGVVQSVGSAVVVKQLDGSTVSVGISRNTRITVDGRPGKISDVKPGFVLVTTVKAGQPTSALRFFRPS